MSKDFLSKDEFRKVARTYVNIIRKTTQNNTLFKKNSRDSICLIYFFLFQLYSEHKNTQRRNKSPARELQV